FCGGIVPGNSREIGPLAAQGVFAFACSFGVAAIEGAAAVTEADLRTAMPGLARIGATLMVHGELPGPIERAVSGQQSSMGFFDRAPWRAVSSRRSRPITRRRPRGSTAARRVTFHARGAASRRCN